MLEGGELAFHMVGSHRRVYLSDLLEYKTKRDRNRHEAIVEGAAVLGIVELDLTDVEGIGGKSGVLHLLPSFSSSSSVAGVTIRVDLWRFSPSSGLSPVTRN